MIPHRPLLKPVLALSLLALVTTISVLRTGFLFGISNNVFHVPLVLGWAQWPAFAGDAFYGSLGKFTSVVWPLLGLIANESQVGWLFLAGHFLSRLLSVLAIAWWLRAGAQATPAGTALALLACALSPWLVGASAVGGHGLWISYFTHSELTWGPLMAALVAALGGHWVLAAALAGVVFSLNAFIGVWALLMLGAVFLLADGGRQWRLLPRVALAFLLLASPALVWIARTVGGDTVNFSYIEYIRAYYPGHFLIEAAGRRELAIAGLSLGMGGLAAWLTPQPRFWWSVLGACALVFGVGAFLPYLLDHRLVFNLHLLRVDGVAQWLSVVLALSVLSVRLFGVRDDAVRLLSLLGLLSLLTSSREPLGLVVAVASLLAVVGLERWPAHLPGLLAAHRLAAARGMALLVLAVGVWRVEWTWLNGFLGAALAMAVLGWSPGRSPAAWLWASLPVVLLTLAPRVGQGLAWRLEDAHPAELTELTTWVRQQGVTGPVLMALSDRDERLDHFQLLSRQPVWVDWKQGAAVMWAPGFHAQWSQRYREVSALTSPPELARYAGANGLRWFLMPQAGAICPAPARERFRNSAYLLCEQP